jgi:hypothetical protein
VQKEQVSTFRRIIAIAVVLLPLAAAGPGLGRIGADGSAAASNAATPGGGVFVYWDQNEEQDYLKAPSGHPQVLVQPYDPNGQMCLLPDDSGRFVTGYNPTNPDQHNPGGLLPFMDPPVGMALWNRDGTWAHQTFYVPGPYHLPDSTIGGDIPPDTSNGEYNNNGTMTGCTFDSHGNLFASDIGTAQGQFPPPDDGRIIMWFAPTYTQSCIVVGPDAGGVGPHHVDGTGGLRDPGQMQADGKGDVFAAEAGSGRVIELHAADIPTSPAQCPQNMRSPLIDPTTFIDAAANGQGFPLGLALDPTCGCWAVGDVIGGAAVAFYDTGGHPMSRPSVPASPDYNPFGLAFTPDGALYFIDIHLQHNPDGSFGPGDNAGGVFRVSFVGTTPQAAVKLTGGYNFPTSVTTCDGTRQVCPLPASALPPDTTTTASTTSTSSTTTPTVAVEPSFTG